MGKICSNTWSVDYIVESELVNERGGFAEEGQWLRRSGNGPVCMRREQYLPDTSRGT